MRSPADKTSSTEAAEPVAPATPVAPEANAAPIHDEDTPAKKAVIVVSGMTIPKAAITIVTEARTYKKLDDDGGLEVTVKKSHYPTGADIYLRYDPEVTFPADAKEVLTMGDTLQQHNFAGFTRLAGHVNVGPAHPAFAAANLAYQRGATSIEIVGLTDAEKERLQPYFDDLANHAVEPAQVAVSFT